MITLNVNELNFPIKRHRVAEWIKNKIHIYAANKWLTLRAKDTHKLKMRGWRKIFHANGNQK